jgi:hypothetical protein
MKPGVTVSGSIVRSYRGEKVWRVVRVPSEAEEDARRRHREREHLQRDSIALSNRAFALLTLHGIRIRSCYGLAGKLAFVS